MDLPNELAETDTIIEQQSISEYTDEIESLQIQIEHLDERNQYLVNVIKQLIEGFSEEEMLEFSKKQFVYELQVNKEFIPKNGHVITKAGDMEILLIERGVGYDFLPPVWQDRARISGNYIDHIVDFNTVNWIPWGTDGTVVTAQGYKATNIKAGQQISFSITDELKERLNIDANSIQIDVK